MATEEKHVTHVEQLQKLRRELLQRIVKNEARRRTEQSTATKEVRKA